MYLTDLIATVPAMPVKVVDLAVKAGTDRDAGDAEDLWCRDRLHGIAEE